MKVKVKVGLHNFNFLHLPQKINRQFLENSIFQLMQNTMYLSNGKIVKFPVVYFMYICAI